MFDQDEKKIRSMMLRRQRNSQPTLARVGCPDEEALASYLSGLLGEGPREQIESHLAACSLCMDEVVTAHRAANEAAEERVPQRIVDRAMSLVPSVRGEQSVLDVVIRLAKDSLELVSTSERWINPLATVPVGVRGKPKPLEATILQVEKEIGKFKVSVEVEKIEIDMCQIVVRVKDDAGKPADGLRLALVSQGREQASYLARQGEAVFDRVPQGEYSLLLSDSGTPVGTIRLKLTG